MLPVDEGNMIVMNISDYKKKMKNLLSDKAYKKLDKDPINTIAQNIKILVEKSNISSKTKSILKPTNSPPRLYGLPKVTKYPPQIDYQRYTFPDIQLIPLPSTDITTSHWKLRIIYNQRNDFIQKIQKI